MSCDKICERLEEEEPPCGEETDSITAQTFEEPSQKSKAFADLVEESDSDFLAEKLCFHHHLVGYKEAVDNQRKYVRTQSYVAMTTHTFKDAEEYRKQPHDSRNDYYLESVEKRTLVIGMEEVLAYISTTPISDFDTELVISNAFVQLGKALRRFNNP